MPTINGLTEHTAAIALDDLIVLWDNSATSPQDRKKTWETALDEIRSQARWMPISTDDYTDEPSSTSRIACSDTSRFFVGAPVRYTYGGTAYYGMVDAISANTYIDVRGAPLVTGGGSNLTELAVGTREMLVQKHFFVNGTYADATNTILAEDADIYDRWVGGSAYLVAFDVTHKIEDTGDEPKVNIHIGGSAVSTADSNSGPQLSTAGTWVENSAVAINTTNYAIAYQDAFEIEVTAAGGSGDAEDLNVVLYIVLE